MASGLRALRWRAAVLLVGAGIVLAWVWMAGGTTHIVQIDWRWPGEMLDTARVEIDGVVVGRLQRYAGTEWITGFEVEPGEHVVRVLLDRCDPVPSTVRLGGEYGRLAILMADVDDGYSCRLFLRGGAR
jgi:hypothetical protein